jgi:hypothetical protein
MNASVFDDLDIHYERNVISRKSTTIQLKLPILSCIIYILSKTVSI